MRSPRFIRSRHGNGGRRNGLPHWSCLLFITAVIAGQTAYAADEPWRPVRTVIYDWSEPRSVEHPDLVRIDDNGVLNAGSVQDACNAAMDRMLEAACEQPDTRAVTGFMVIRSPITLRRGSEVRTVSCPGLVLTRTERVVPWAPDGLAVQRQLRAPAEALLRAEDKLRDRLRMLGDPIRKEFAAAFSEIPPVPVWPALYEGTGPDDPVGLADVLWRGYEICRVEVEYDVGGPSVSITLLASPACCWNLQRVSDWFYVARFGQCGPQLEMIMAHDICPTQGIEVGVVIDDPAIVLRGFGAAPITPTLETPMWDVITVKSPAAHDLAVRRAVDHLFSLIGDDAAPWLEGREAEWIFGRWWRNPGDDRETANERALAHVLAAVRTEFRKTLASSSLTDILVTPWQPPDQPEQGPLTQRQIYVRFGGDGWDDRGGISHWVRGARFEPDTTVGVMKYILVDPNKIHDPAEQELWGGAAARMVEIVQRGPDEPAEN
jgi:hypothetical protein